MRKRPITAKIADFLWKLTHDCLKCGKYFSRWNAEQQWCKCAPNIIENPEHILTECPLGNQADLWLTAGQIWTKEIENIPEADAWQKPDIHEIRAIGCWTNTKDIPRKKGDKQKHLTASLSNLRKILVSETAWNIWKLRCERVINEKDRPRHQYTETLKEAFRRRIIIEWGATRWISQRKRHQAIVTFKETWCIQGTIATLTDNKLQINKTLGKTDPEKNQIEESDPESEKESNVGSVDVGSDSVGSDNVGSENEHGEF